MAEDNGGDEYASTGHRVVRQHKTARSMVCQYWTSRSKRAGHYLVWSQAPYLRGCTQQYGVGHRPRRKPRPYGRTPAVPASVPAVSAGTKTAVPGHTLQYLCYAVVACEKGG
eukprot:1879396-Rhodomonas_salina.1